MRPNSSESRNGVEPEPREFTAFAGHRCIATGALADVVMKTKSVIDGPDPGPVIIFDTQTSEQLELDLRGTREQILRWVTARTGEGPETVGSQGSEPRRPGRPKLGVVGREVTLLPRHWEWLDGQPGGASVALRRLVEAAKRSSLEKDRARRSQEAVHRFMWALTGDLPGFEEASRAFYARNYDRFHEITQPWPEDIRYRLEKLVAVAARDQAAASEARAV